MTERSHPTYGSTERDAEHPYRDEVSGEIRADSVNDKLHVKRVYADLVYLGLTYNPQTLFESVGAKRLRGIVEHSIAPSEREFELLCTASGLDSEVVGSLARSVTNGGLNVTYLQRRRAYENLLKHPDCRTSAELFVLAAQIGGLAFARKLLLWVTGESESAPAVRSWVAKQQREYHDRAISGEVASLLESLSGWTWGEKPKTDDLANPKQAQAYVRERLCLLDKREQIVMYRRVLTDKPDKLHIIGKDLGVSREAVRQIERIAVSKMVHPTSRNLPKPSNDAP